MKTIEGVEVHIVCTYEGYEGTETSETTIYVGKDSVEEVLEWHSAYYGGGDCVVYINDIEVDWANGGIRALL